MKLFTIYDIKAEKAGPIFQAENQFVAIRNMYNGMKDVQYLEEFQLLMIGEYNERTASIKPFDVKERIEFMEQFNIYRGE